MDLTNKKPALESFEKLLIIMDELREQCPWDKKQTIETLRQLTIEETFELADAISQKNTAEIKNELGDILLHIVFYARMGSETNDFDIKGVIDGICEKLIRRHPHIYGDVTADTEEQVKQNWEQIKLTEGKGKDKTTVLGGVPSSLPSLVKAYRIQEKASAVGFDWKEKAPVWGKVQEELQEFKDETDHPNPSKERMEDEFGDLLFSLVNFARFEGLNPDNALDKTNQKFIRRFNFLEAEAKKAGKDLSSMTLAEMDEYWNLAKANKL